MAKPAPAAGIASGQCLCGKVAFEIDVPARWAWHDHSAASRRAHGAAYATYVGSWRKRFRIIKGKTLVARYEVGATKTVRSFCSNCGTPLFYERARSPHMVNISRALFESRTGRQPLYHIAIEEAAGMGLYRRAAGAAERRSRRGLAALEEEAPRRGRRPVRARPRGHVRFSSWPILRDAGYARSSG
jgi:hypothetical protein